MSLLASPKLGKGTRFPELSSLCPSSGLVSPVGATPTPTSDTSMLTRLNTRLYSGPLQVGHLKGPA